MIRLGLCCSVTAICCAMATADGGEIKISVTIDRGRDLGQNFGSLFEVATEDGTLVIGAGFQNLYNTRLRGDRHQVELFIRRVDGERRFDVSALPRPNKLCGTYLYGRDGVVRSTIGGVKAWDPPKNSWREEPSAGGTEEIMRVGNGLLEFGDSTVKYNERVILGPPDRGTYQLFFYANGHLCFYHVNRGEGDYRPYQSDAEGFSKLYACPWTASDGAVDLAKAVVLTLPMVGETTFAWGQMGPQVFSGSNLGGFYIFEDGKWRMLLEPKLGVSYQLYSTMALRDRFVMGQYPTGRLFAYNGKEIADLTGWPPQPKDVSGSAREAQTTVIYGGEMFVGVWPWGELWRYNPDTKSWILLRRMFEHPETSTKITHPYDEENRGNPVSNLWGQRVTSLVTSGGDLFVSTSAKYPCEWEPEKYPFLAPVKWKSYGTVYRVTAPGHLSGATKWTEGPTTLEFVIRGGGMTILQDGRELAFTKQDGPISGKLGKALKLKTPTWGDGVYGKFNGAKLDGKVLAPR